MIGAAAVLSCVIIVFFFQLHAAIAQNENLELLGLGTGSSLVTSLKQRVVSLASNSGVISTVQVAAQNTLQNGWSILLPTAEERARALSSLLSNGGKFSTVFSTITALCVTIILKGSLTLAMGKCLWFSVKIKVSQLSLSSP